MEYLDILQHATFYYNTVLNSNNGEAAIAYLDSRGISMQTANNFLLGCSGPSHNSLVAALAKEEFPVKDIYNSTLATIRFYSNNDNRMVDYFEPGRIIFPILDSGKTVFMSSRSFDGSYAHKHLTSEMFDNKYLFNQDVLKQKHQDIYITEGIFDALTLESIGKPAVATLGTGGIRPVHRELFNNTSKDTKFIFVFDNDRNGAGDSAALKSAGYLRGFGFDKIFQIILPCKNDSTKTDVNGLFVKVNNQQKFKKGFENLKLIPINVEPKCISMCTNYNGISRHISNSVPIVDIISRYLELEQIGQYTYRTLCPFHQDTKPSFVIFTQTNTFKCFGGGCGIFGGPAKFLEYKLGITFKEAIEKIKNGEF